MIVNLFNTELANLIPKARFNLTFLYELIHETYFNAAGTIDNKRKNKLKSDEFRIIKEYNKISNDINFDDKNRTIPRKLNKSIYAFRNRTLINDSIRNIEKRVFEDERVCQSFFHKYKGRQNRKHMKELTDNDGNLLDNDDAINEYVLKQISKTFKGPEPGIDINTFNDFCKKYNINLPSIDAELANSLKDPINKHLISSAISNLKNS